MSAEEDRSDPLVPLIEAILDGRPPDATTADTDASLDTQQRTLLEPLRILAAIALLPEGRIANDTGTDERFVLEGEIGRGAFGTVYRAWDRTLRRHVALKIIPLRLPLAASVLSEARRLARVRHPNVVTIHDVFERGHEGRICMELLSGQTLAQIVAKRRRLPVEEVVAIGTAGAPLVIHLNAGRIEQVELERKWRGGLDPIQSTGNHKAADDRHLRQVGRNGDRSIAGATVDDGGVVGRVGGVKSFSGKCDGSIQHQIFCIPPGPHLDNITGFRGVDGSLNGRIIVRHFDQIHSPVTAV